MRRLRAVLEAAPEPTELRAVTLLAAAALELRCGELTSFTALAREAETLARGMRASFAADVVHRAGLLYSGGVAPDDCTAACADALALAPEQDWPVRASILSAFALTPFYLGDFTRSRGFVEASLDALAHVPEGTPPFFEGFTFGFTVLPEGPEGRLRPLFEETIMFFHRFARGAAEAYCLCKLAILARSEDRRDDNRALLDEALSRFRQLRDSRGEAHTLCILGNCARTFGEPDLALASLEQALELRRRSGDRRAVGITENDIALALAFSGDLAGARALFTVAHDRFRAADDAPGQGGVLVMWGIAEERSGRLERASELFTAGAEVWERHLRGHLPGWAWLTAADALLATGEAERARIGIERAERLLARVGDMRGLALCRANAAKAVQRVGKDASS
ncbi:MAG: tetratricopeptide repeat protein [Actinomycetota bacterium]|nr:tetratricopeptide repeat protein [Actinomycetota bacterium]